MKAELLKGKAMDRTFVDFAADSAMLELVDRYERHSLQIGFAKQDYADKFMLFCKGQAKI